MPHGEYLRHVLTVLYIGLGSRYSQLGNPWQTVVQLYSQETRHMFESRQSDRGTPTVVGIDDEPIDRIPVSLGKSSNSGRVALRRSRTVRQTAEYE